MSAETTATEELARLSAEAEKRRQRVDAIADEQRAATERAQAASEALTQFEREHPTGRAAERAELERELGAARAAATAPWPEKLEGARRRVADAQAEVRSFVGAHRDELVAEVEGRGADVAAKLTETAEALVELYQQRERIAGELSQLIALAGVHARPGDVSFSKAEALAREATRLTMNGGEVGPTWKRRPVEAVPAA